MYEASKLCEYDNHFIFFEKALIPNYFSAKAEQENKKPLKSFLKLIYFLKVSVKDLWLLQCT